MGGPGAPAVLVVDDDARVAVMLRDVLEACGYRAQVALSAPEALERIGATRFAAVVADVVMPGMDGVSLYQLVRQHYPELRGRFIMITADVTTPRLAEVLWTGEVLCLAKPFTIEEAAAAVRLVVEGGGPRRARATG